MWGIAKPFEQFVSFLETTEIKPVIDRVFAFDEAREAYVPRGRQVERTWGRW